MAIILTIEYDLTRDKVILRTPLSSAEFTDTETDRQRLFRAIKANAEYKAGMFKGPNTLGKDVSEAILAYDESMVRKVTERKKKDVPDILKNLELDIADLSGLGD